MGGFAECFADLRDPRTGNPTRHLLLEVLMIALCAMQCGAEGCVDMEAFGKAKERFLKKFLSLPHGIQSHDTFSRIFRSMYAEQFGRCFQACAVCGVLNRHSPYEPAIGQQFGSFRFS